MGAVCSGILGVGEDGGGPATTFPLFSPQAFAAGKKKSGSDTLWDEFPLGGDTKGMVRNWKLSPENPLELRYAVGGSGENLETMSRPLHGATIKEPTSVHVCVTSLFPWTSPCATKGKSVIMAHVSCMDIYMSVDGKDQDDRMVIRADASQKDAAIDAGPPEGVWCRLINKHWEPSGRDAHALHLPLVIKGDPNVVTLNASSDYAADLNAAFCQLAASVGDGEHSYTMRVCPRGYVKPDSVSTHFPYGCGKSIAADTKEFMSTMKGQVISAELNNPKLNATFKLSLDSQTIKNSLESAQKKAPKPGNGNGEYKEIAEAAKRMAGNAISMATNIVGEEFSGPCDHVIVCDDFGTVDGSGSGANCVDDRKYFCVCAYVLWKGAGSDTGVMVKFALNKHVKQNFQIIANPKWEFERVTGGEKLSNQAIDDAIQRDAGRV